MAYSFAITSPSIPNTKSPGLPPRVEETSSEGHQVLHHLTCCLLRPLSHLWFSWPSNPCRWHFIPTLCFHLNFSECPSVLSLHYSPKSTALPHGLLSDVYGVFERCLLLLAQCCYVICRKIKETYFSRLASCSWAGNFQSEGKVSQDRLIRKVNSSIIVTHCSGLWPDAVWNQEEPRNTWATKRLCQTKGLIFANSL